MLQFDIENKSVWETLQDTKDPIIMYGTGNGADKVFEAFKRLGISVAGVTASDGFVRERYFHDFRVTPVSEFLEKYEKFTIVVTFGSSRPEVIENIKKLSEKQTVLVPCVPVIGNEIFDRKFLKENEENLNKAYSILADEKSKEVFKNYVNFQFSGKLSYLFNMESDISTPFNDYLKLSENESFIDIGAYRGDTVEQFLSFTNRKYKNILALEPDPKTYKKLIANCENLKNFEAINGAASSFDGAIEFSNAGGRQSTIGSGAEIPCYTLDKLSEKFVPTYIKIDAEGAEADIIKGGKDLINKHRPKIKIAAYHKNRDIFEIPILLNELNKDYKIYMCHHPYIPAWDTDFYVKWVYKMEEANNIFFKEREEIIKISVSSPFSKDEEFNKMTIRPVIIKKAPCFQAERFKNNQVFHLNMAESEFSAFLEDIFKKYAQIAIFKNGETITFSISPNGKIKKSSSKNNLKQKSKNTENNRQKEYIFNEGENIPALVDLGVFTPDFKIVNSKYDKFKQINRFIEIVNDAFVNDKNENITILDFGCGKSYLTFIIYYFFTEVKKKNVRIIGYDLKKDVVENCNKIAEKYGYKNLKFVVSDVTKDTLYDEHIDMVISLHACDTATDFALNYAIKKNVKYIFSVPCCQHEVNKTIKKGGDFDILLKHGLIKERMSALLTDSIRAGILEDMGYSVDVLEFVDFSHSPKNIMIRAKKTKKPSNKNRNQIKELQEKYGFTQTLCKLVGDYNE